MVNGEAVPDALVRAEAEALRPKFFESMPTGDPIELEMQLREWSKENVIERVLFTQEAARLSVPVEELVTSIQHATAKPKPKEVADYYRQHRSQLWVPELIRASHIVRNIDETHPEAEALQAIESAQVDLRSGIPFATVADRNSDCSGNGGDLGWFPRGAMVPEFERVLFAMKAGEVSPIFQTPFGFHIALCKARKPEGIPAFADVRSDLEARILRERRQADLDRFVDLLRARAKISL